MSLERYRKNGKCLLSMFHLHEFTEYMVREKDGMSDALMPARGLREECSTSPNLFNVEHQAVMRGRRSEE